jgi:iron complex outermembrane receptor protein
LPNNISATYFTNAINTRTQGYDLVGSYDLDVGDFGQMLLNASLNYNVTTITHIVPNPPQLAALGAGYVIFDARSQGNLTLGLPKTKVVLSDNWNWNDFTLIPKLIRFGGFTSVQNLASQTRSYNAKWIADLELEWHVSPQWSVAVGANNLFDTYPSPAGIFNPATGTGQYPGTSPFGFTGGFYYARVNVAL